MQAPLPRLLALILVAAAACKSGGGTNGAQALASPQAFQDALDATSCATAIRCGVLGASEATTCASNAASARQAFPSPYSVTDAVKAGRLTYDPASAARCLSALGSAPCTANALLTRVADCDAVFTPVVAVGSQCFSSGECVGGYCDAPEGCAGTCRAHLATGANCANATQCDPGTDFCDPGSESCTTLPVAGASCSGEGSCGPALFCVVSGSNTTGACQSAGSAGDVCRPLTLAGSTCSPGLYCDTTASPAVCAARLGQGSTCASDAACSDTLACVGLTLDPASGAVTASGKCGPLLDVGSACDPNVDSTGCPFYQKCDSSTRRCVLMGFSGDDCSGTGYCREHLTCDQNSKCSSTLAAGAACDATNDTCDTVPCDPGSAQCAIACQN